MAIIGYPACKAELARLLAMISSRMAALSPDDEDGLTDAVIASGDQLAAFEASSVPESMSDTAEVAAIAKLDALARAAAIDLNLAGLTQIIDGIRQRAEELAALTNMLDQQTVANVSAEKKLRLVPIRNAIVSATATVESFKILKKSLNQADPDEAAILAGISALIGQFGELRRSMNNAGVNV